MPLIDNKINSFQKKVADLPDQPSLNQSPAEIKAHFDSSPEELRVSLNKVIDSVISEYTNKTGDHPGTWQGLTPPLIGAGDLNGSRLDLIESERVNVKRFGAVGNGTIDDTVAIQNAINSLTTSGTLYFPKGTYKITSPLTNSLNVAIRFEGQGKFSSILSYRGSGIFFTNTGPSDTVFKDIQVTGWQSGDATYFRVGTTGIKTTGNLIIENSYLQGFQTLIYWNGGFYHQFEKVRFQKANKVMDNAYANNLVFRECRALEIDNFVVASAGTGSIYVSGSAFEQWTTTLFSVSAGAKPQLVLEGNYIENYPLVAAGNGLAKAFFDTAFVASGYDGYTFIGNTFTTGGVRRIVNNSAVDTSNIISIGNIINYSGTTSDSLEYAFLFQNLKSANMNDYAKVSIPGTGIYTTAYVSGSYANTETCKVFNPFTNKDVSPEVAWTNATLLNGWVQNVTAGNNTISYRKIGNTIHLKGVIDGSAASSNVMFNIPGLTLTKTNWRTTGAIGGTTSLNLRMLTNGDIRCETMGTNQILLDGLKFDII